MKTITYLTTNQYKFKEAQLIFEDKYGLDIEIKNPDFEIYEIQAETCGEVAAFSAKYAADQLGVPCLKSDTGLYIDALGGLPGPYNHYFDVQIGAERFLELFKNETNRRARIEHCFAYCEPGGEPKVFKGECFGTIAMEKRGEYGRWHDFFFIPDGETRTLAEIGDEDPAKKIVFGAGGGEACAKWIAEQQKNEV